MSSFKGFVVKEFKQIYRDKRTLAVLFGMPVIMMLIFGFAIRNEINSASLAVLDHSRDVHSRNLVAKLDASGTFSVNRHLDDVSQIESTFREGEIGQVVVIAPDFAKTLLSGRQADIQLITDASNPNLSKLVQEYATAIVNDYQNEIGPQNQNLVPGAALQPVMMFNPTLESVNLFVPGLIAVILMLICTLMTSISITREKEMGNMEVLLVSPLRPLHIVVGKTLPYLALAFLDVLAILLLARLVFDVPVRGSYILLLGESLLFIFVALSLGVFISTRTDDQQTAMMVSLAGLLLPTVLLSGFIFPISSMPGVLQWLSNLIPARWFLVIVRGVMLKDAGLPMLWKETLILVVMMAGFVGLSIANFKSRLE
ncbi:MAG: ABC transporter permease [Balneolaceae bacterium]|nr:ABC transporter permease [Balneolaceae bacterium]